MLQFYINKYVNNIYYGYYRLITLKIVKYLIIGNSKWVTESIRYCSFVLTII